MALQNIIRSEGVARQVKIGVETQRPINPKAVKSLMACNGSFRHFQMAWHSLQSVCTMIKTNFCICLRDMGVFSYFGMWELEQNTIEDSDAGNTVEVVPDIGPAVKENAMSQMDAAVVALSRELSKLRTGRASAGMLDHIIVETGGVKMPLSRLAVVSVLDPKTLSVTPYDLDVMNYNLKSCCLKFYSLCQALKQLENAIVSSPLGLNPKADGERLIAVIPPLTKEHIQAMCKVVAKSCEDVKQSIRRARQKALDTIKKAGSSLPKDVAKRLEKEVDELTKKFVKSAEDMCKAKEKEIAEG
ncbi:Ribosome-recycling factor [Vitis vinifera]|uniref:Ribosome-recycling factor, chloroplastic n=1 Tax=Vitis vinifera TaxID=29760 RepID=A0A438BT38_VITVI|nr:Ribosome-recycling factor [Vitis vinifera]